MTVGYSQFFLKRVLLNSFVSVSPFSNNFSTMYLHKIFPGFFSLTLYSATWKRGDFAAAKIAQPLATDSVAFKVLDNSSTLNVFLIKFCKAGILVAPPIISTEWNSVDLKPDSNKASWIRLPKLA